VEGCFVLESKGQPKFEEGLEQVYAQLLALRDDVCKPKWVNHAFYGCLSDGDRFQFVILYQNRFLHSEIFSIRQGWRRRMQLFHFLIYVMAAFMADQDGTISDLLKL